MSRQPASKANMAQSAQSEESFDIISSDSWVPENHNFGLAKANKSGQGNSAPMTYNNRKYYLKFPKMFSPFGASTAQPKPGEAPSPNPKFSIQLAFGDDVSNATFQKKVERFDTYVISDAMKPDKQLSWLGAPKTKPYHLDVVTMKYSHMIKRPIDKVTKEINSLYPPFIRANITTSFKDHTLVTTEVYDFNNELMTVDLDSNSPNHISKKIPPGSQISGLMVGSVWCNPTGFGVTWNLAQVKVFPAKGLPKGKCLVDDPEDTDVSTENDTTSTDGGVAADVQDEDVTGEDDVIEVEESEPVEVEEVPEPVHVPAVVVAPPKTRITAAKATTAKATTGKST